MSCRYTEFVVEVELQRSRSSTPMILQWFTKKFPSRESLEGNQQGLGRCEITKQWTWTLEISEWAEKADYRTLPLLVKPV